MGEGGCLCGAVRYRVEGAPLRSGICHCESCRRAGAAPSLPFVTFPEEAVSFTGDAPAEFRSSPPVRRGFCGRCGSPLTYRHRDKPGTVDLMTCSLDDPEAFPPTVHVGVGEKIGWDVVADGLPAFRSVEAEGTRA